VLYVLAVDMPNFSLDEILTAIERRIPGGPFTANLVFAILLIWLVIVAMTGIVDGLIPLIDYLGLRQQPLPRVDVKKATSAVLALVALILIVLATTAWLSRFRRTVGTLGDRVGYLNAITTLIELKEAGTELLNQDLTGADQATIANWHLRLRLWEEGVVTALERAGAPQAAISDFRTLITFKPVGPAISEEHAREKGMLAGRLHRLRVIINDLDRSTRDASQLEKLRRLWPKGEISE